MGSEAAAEVWALPAVLGLGPAWDPVLRFVAFAALIVLSYMVGRLLREGGRLLRRTPPTSSSLILGRLLVAALVLTGAWIGLSRIYDVNPVGLLATLGIASLALGFGLQNTVANVAAGVGLAVDKPFDVGDRIRVGETWGDVVGIGLRSTRIRTTAGEHVVVPNSLLDTQEVWNYTHHQHRELRLEVSFQVTYQSSVALAEHLALQAARASEGVLAYPEPFVRVRGLDADGVGMELRVWLGQATDKAAVLDELLRGIKRRFDAEGVQFPFPQRTISRLKDLPAPAPTPEFVREEAAGRPIVLVTTRGAGPGKDAADRVVEFIDRVGARMIVVHVRPPTMALHARQAQEAVNLFLQSARRRGVPAHGRMEAGDVAPVLAAACKESGVRLVALAARQQRFFGWHHKELRTVRDATGRPVVFLDARQELEARFVERWRERLQPQAEASPDAEAEGAPEGADANPSSASTGANLSDGEDG